jgi:hypothetical protein
MNLIATPVARFTALNPQHNLALRSEGPISRQIAHHPTLTRNARSSPRILRVANMLLCLFLALNSWKWAHNGLSPAMESHWHRIVFGRRLLTLELGIAQSV